MKLAVRTCLSLGALVGAGACAHVEAPRGGPEMLDPLTLTAVEPDSLAVVPGHRGPVVFRFERRLSERGLDDAVIVSPRTSSVAVGHRGRELRVGLRGGWAPGHIYHVTVTPTIQDLWNNRLTEGITHVFSTGPRIPDTRLDGRARDRITGRPEVDIRVEAIREPDSLVYATRTDSTGGFAFRRVPEGEYRVRAYRDTNRNRQLDPFEPRDTTFATVTIEEPVEVRLSVVMPDTTPPVLASAELTDAGIELRFDDHLDPAQELAPAQVRITDPAGTVIPVARLAVGRLPPEDDGNGDIDRPQPPVPVEPAAPPAPPPPPADAAEPPDEPLPSQVLIVEPAAPLEPATEYAVQVEGVRNVVDLVGGGEATFTTPEPPPDPGPDAPADPDPDFDAPDEPGPDAAADPDPDVPPEPEPDAPGEPAPAEPAEPEPPPAG